MLSVQSLWLLNTGRGVWVSGEQNCGTFTLMPEGLDSTDEEHAGRCSAWLLVAACLDQCAGIF